MNNNMHTGAGFMEGRTYTVGRDGHIKIDDPSVSRGHAEIKFTEGRIHLRDLSSTNGTYVVKDNKLLSFEQGYVNPNQRLVIGSSAHTVKSLLATIGVFASYSKQTGLTIKLARPSKNLRRG